MTVPDPDELLYLDAAQVADLSRTIDPLQVVTDSFLAVHAGKAGITPEAALRWRASDGTGARSLVLPAWHGDSYGCKIINACVGNPDRGLPRAHGLILLFDPDTAMPVCVMEGGRLSALRTAAVSLAAVRGVRDLGDIRHLAFLGAGRQADTHLELFAARTHPVAVTVHDMDAGRAAAFADRVARTLPDAAVEVAATPRDAVRAGDVTIAATTTTTAYVPLEWLPRGAVFVNVSLDDATEELLLGCDHLLVDDWPLVAEDETRLLGRLAHAGRVTGPDAAPPQGGRQVDADLATLFSGGYRRPVSAADRIVVNPFGMGVHDVALAALVYAAARRNGTGTRLAR
ncbi:ornithine cyclodeaminase [Streptomyces hygroscopicus]|uniref:ornithine cyclodeaminase n=1 Tax=Streptomyces hygroscopicus TaxID=1912 RepID=UPI0008338D9F|nr:ornithine cyclodeaminase [Streptomyces hygroscopicus]GLV75857.1 ornithine cyclodeaminase [Streptomyces hygroscopicus subsp. hygroscopicus]